MILLAVFILHFIRTAIGVDVWCGKAYRAEDTSFDPGGWLNPPLKSDVPLLNFQAYPRKSIYLADEDEAGIVVDAEITQDVGVPYCQLRAQDDAEKTKSEIWLVEIVSEDHLDRMVQIYIMPNTTGNTAEMDISYLAPRLEPYTLKLTLKTPDCMPSYESQLQIYRLPMPDHDGSVTRLDYLHGGLEVRKDHGWKQVFPFGFYADWGGYLKHETNQDAYKSLDYSIVSPVPAGGDEPFEPNEFASYVKEMDKHDASIMYNMRWTYKNDQLVTAQVEEVKKHKSILLWYTADEPGGQGDPLDAPLKSYDVVKKIDPYHPVSLVLNCANFHYAEYTRGADIILTDPYPISVNTSWSSRWNTKCNTTYGCCGCDNCVGSFRDVSNRLDNFKNYQRWLSNAPLGQIPTELGRSAGGPKAFWGVPQVFGGSEYWQRPPTVQEEIVMVWLFINHGAKGIIGWLFPTTPELTSMLSEMAKVVTDEKVTALLLGDNPRRLEVGVEEGVDIDVAAWIVGRTMLVSVVYLGLEDTKSPVVVKLPYSTKSGTVRHLWPSPHGSELDAPEYAFGETSLRDQSSGQWWEASQSRRPWQINGSEARRLGLPAMFVSVFTVSIEIE